MYAALTEGQKSRLNNSQKIFDTVNGYITDSVFKKALTFEAKWILVVRWIDVCSYLDGNCTWVRKTKLMMNFIMSARMSLTHSKQY